MHIYHSLHVHVSKSSKFSSTSVSTSSYTIVNIYRPPSLPKPAFISDFTSLLESLISTPSKIVITGDFNFHCDQPTDPSVSSFLELLDAFGLKQHIAFPTHDSGHTLDLVITRATSSFVTSSCSIFTPISDHLLVLSNFSIPVKSRPTRTTKTTRPINKIDTKQFSNDVFASVLYSYPATTLDAYVQQFSDTLPLCLISTPQRKPHPSHLLHPNHSLHQKFAAKNLNAPVLNQFLDPQNPKLTKITTRHNLG